MKINAVAVTTSNLKETVRFYQALGFSFPEYKEDEQHLEAITPDGSARLMIDSHNLIKDILGEDPKPGNHSSFAIEFDTPDEVNKAAEKVKNAGFTIVKEPWDAFWGQRYAVLKDPDGYMIDLYAAL